MAKRHRQLHFKTVLILGMISMLFLHMLISDIISAKELKQQITLSVNNDNELIADALSDKLELMFVRPIDEIDVISHTIQESSTIGTGFDQGIRVTQHMRYFDRIILVNDADLVIKVWPYNNYVLGMDQSGTGYRRLIGNGQEAFWSGTYINYTSGEISIDLVKPIGDSYLVGTIYLEELTELIAPLNTKPGTIVAIVDKNNTYIAHTESYKVRQRFKDSYLANRPVGLAPDPSEQVLVDGVLMRPFIKTLEAYGWSVLIYYPVSLYEKPVWNLLFRIIAVQVASLSVIIALSVLGSHYLNRLLKKLFGFMKQIEEGQYDLKGPKVFLTELGEVITGFEHMALKIQARESEIIEKSQEIQQMNEELESRIHERTIDLELANQNLTHTVQSLINAQEQLVQQEKLSSLGSLVEGIAHEVNTPLGISITTATFMEQEINEATDQINNGTITREDIDDFLAVMQESSRILGTNLKATGELVENFKSIAVEQKSFSMVDATLKDILSTVFMELGYLADDPQFHVSIRPEFLRIRCFPEDLVLILFNLLRNALIHGRAEDPDETIDIQIDQLGEGIQIRVIDKGRGIPEEYLKRVFDPFFTTRRGNTDTSGRGLGLYIIYNLIDKRYKGSITCESEPGSGSTFEVLIPDCVVPSDDAKNTI